MRFNDDELFLRRIDPHWFDFEKQEIQSWAFGNHNATPDRMSVNWEKLSSVAETINEFPSCGVASITAEDCYELDQKIDYTPTDKNKAHCDVIGEKSTPIKRRLKKKAKLLRAPSPLPLTDL